MLSIQSIFQSKPSAQGRAISFTGDVASSVMGSRSWMGTSITTGGTGDDATYEDSGCHRHVDGLISGKEYIISLGGMHSV